jgi:FAD/FMN-containing dehydrogenase
LAFFCRVELALNARPGATSSALAAFATLESAAIAATRARESGAVACELLDRTFLDVAAGEDHPISVPPGTEAILLAEVEGADSEQTTAAIGALAATFRSAGATHVETAVDRASEAALWAFRHAASPIMARLDPSLRSMQFIEDGAVPPARLADYVRGVRAALARYHTRGVIFGHAGDSHVHVNPLIDVSRPGWQASAQSLFDDVVALTASLGGTVSGEHGDGRLRTPVLDRLWPREVIEAFRGVKACFDPAGVLNPGVKVSEPCVTPASVFAATRYDPRRAVLPASAERALTTVDQERGYARFRLDLLAP